MPRVEMLGCSLSLTLKINLQNGRTHNGEFAVPDFLHIAQTDGLSATS